MLLSAVSVLVVAQSSSEIPEGLMNNPVCIYINIYIYEHICCEFICLDNKGVYTYVQLSDLSVTHLLYLLPTCCICYPLTVSQSVSAVILAAVIQTAEAENFLTS